MPVRIRPRGSGHDDRGAVAIVVAGLMVVFMGLAALVVDLGFARDRVRTAQNAADAAALAVATCFASATSGCNSVPVATATAQQYISANGWTFDPSTVSIDTTAQTATVTLPAQQTPSFFAGALSLGTPSVTRTARATWNNSAPVTCVLCVLQNFDGQSADITLGGGLAVGGDLSFDTGAGSVSVTSPSGTVSFGGTWDLNGTFTVNGAPATPVRMAFPLTDPFAGVTAPTLMGRGRPGSGACSQGVYSDLSGCSSLASDSVYVVTGNGVTDTPVTLPASSPTNIMIYFTCGRAGRRSVGQQACSRTSPGAYLAGSSGAATIGGQTSGPYQGFAVVYDPNNVVDARLTGSGALTIDGDVYGPSVTADFGGNGTGSVTVNGTVVVGDVILHGSGESAQFDVPGGGNPRTVAPGTPIHLIP